MKKNEGLLEGLIRYQNSDRYPFHMPGHKRQFMDEFAENFPNPFSIDITEIDEFDNLHHPQGILRDSMEWASSVYGSDRTYYLVNGSSCGILSAICGTTNNSDTILLCRNSHKSAYNGVILNHLQVRYIYPQILDKYCVQGGLLSGEIEEMLKTHEDIRGIFVVSPTYDGVVSDIKTIATIAHRYKIPLIVDEAHGAHFHFGKDFPVSALDLGADVVIQSLHKTLPSLTQTALMHVKEGYVDIGRIEQYLHLFQSSSPSYVFLAAIENCIRFVEADGGKRMELFARQMKGLRERLGGMHCLKLLDEEVVGQKGVFDLDWSKVVISTRDTDLDGVQLDQILRERYHLEMEMCSAECVTAITTLADTAEGLQRLEQALLEIDGEIDERKKQKDFHEKAVIPALVKPQAAMTIFEAVHGRKETVMLEDSAGRISGEFIYVYPPGIPVAAPGEVLQKELVEMIRMYQKMGLSVQGPLDQSLREIQVMAGADV